MTARALQVVITRCDSRRRTRSITHSLTGQLETFMVNVMAAASEILHIPPEAIVKCPRWSKDAHAARSIVIYLAMMRGHSMNKCAQYFRRDHTTILYAIRRLERVLPYDDKLRADMMMIAIVTRGKMT